jgi:hypothetical protein
MSLPLERGLQGTNDAFGLATFAPDHLPDVFGNVPRPLALGLDTQLFDPLVGVPPAVWWHIRPDRRPATWGWRAPQRSRGTPPAPAVVHDLPANVTAVGVPARVIEIREEGWHER